MVFRVNIAVVFVKNIYPPKSKQFDTYTGYTNVMLKL